MWLPNCSVLLRSTNFTKESIWSVHRGTIIKNVIEGTNWQSPSIVLLAVFISSRVAAKHKRGAYRPLIDNNLLFVDISNRVRLACRLSTSLPSPNAKLQLRVFACFRPFTRPKTCQLEWAQLWALLAVQHPDLGSDCDVICSTTNAHLSWLISSGEV